VLQDPPLLWAIELSEQLAKTKLIAEAWDAAGLYQVGSFPGYRWAEWNGQYRDVVRRFVRGDQGLINELATRICGSNDLYEHSGRLPINSVNFVTCHDGFTLYDLFSYNEKHNYANGENNQDGCNNNLSYNCGIEGDTDNTDILTVRRRQAKNVFAILLLSHGVPMLLAGDELLNSQHGNNNGYCQDNELSWIDWNMAEQNADMLRFVQLMIALRKRHISIMRRRFLSGKSVNERGLPEIQWHGTQLNQPLWADAKSQILAFTLVGIDSDEVDLHVVMNMSDQQVSIDLPVIPNRAWCLSLDTSLASPQDIVPLKDQQQLIDNFYQVNGRTVVVFENKSY